MPRFTVSLLLLTFLFGPVAGFGQTPAQDLPARAWTLSFSHFPARWPRQSRRLPTPTGARPRLSSAPGWLPIRQMPGHFLTQLTWPTCKTARMMPWRCIGEPWRRIRSPLRRTWSLGCCLPGKASSLKRGRNWPRQPNWTPGWRELEPRREHGARWRRSTVKAIQPGHRTICWRLSGLFAGDVCRYIAGCGIGRKNGSARCRRGRLSARAGSGPEVGVSQCWPRPSLGCAKKIPRSRDTVAQRAGASPR